MPKVELQPETGKKQALADEVVKVASVRKLFSSSLRVGLKK
jgi:hypothetical protein